MDGVIISGGTVDSDFTADCLSELGITADLGHACDRLIAADKGLLWCAQAHMVPAHIVGDFDSSGLEILKDYQGRRDVEIRRFIPEKNYTDTDIAVSLAMELKWKRVLLLGATGTRMDHMLGNIQVAARAAAGGCRVITADPHNRITVHTQSFQLEKTRQWGSYVSFFPWGEQVENLTLQGFAYPLENYLMENTITRCVSNEIVDEQASVSFTKGTVVCVEARD